MITICIICIISLVFIFLLYVLNNINLHTYFNIIDRFRGDIDDDNKEQSNSNSQLIGGKEGIKQLLPHCSDLNLNKSCSNRKIYPDCCDPESFKKGKCFPNFPKKLLYYKENGKNKRRQPDDLCEQDFKDGKAPNIYDPTNYLYNPHFMYSQEASKDQGFLDRHIIDNLVFAPQPGKEEDEKQKYYRMNTFSTLGYDKDDPKI